MSLRNTNNSNNPFRLQAKNSLKINQVHHQQQNQKTLLNNFKSGYDLRNQLVKSNQQKMEATLAGKSKFGLGKAFNQNTQNFSATMMQANKKKEEQVSAQQVIALDNFKAPVTRQKTKDLIQNIKLRRRQKHIDCLSRFKQDLDDYKQNLFSIYSSLLHDTKQVLTITQNQLDSHFNTFTNQYLLTREKQFLSQIVRQVSNFQESSMKKVNATKLEIERIKSSRNDVVQNTCSDLRNELIQIAFVLQNQAKQIESKQKQEIQKLEIKYYQQYKDQITKISQSQEQKNKKIVQKGDQIMKRWKQIKEQYELQQYIQDCDKRQYRNPEKRRKIYNQAIQLQNITHKLKYNHLQSLIKQNPDALTKFNIQKWSEILKSINDQFDKNLDQLIKAMMIELEESKDLNKKRFDYMKNRLEYIQLHYGKPQELEQLLNQKCVPLLERNNKDAHELIKKVTNYIETCDNKQNDAINSFISNFMMKLGTKNDENNQQFNLANQKYELQKAKILDDDQEQLDKLNQQFSSLKKELRQSLHHIKLQEIQKKCFDKIDQIQVAYRKTHDSNKDLVQTRIPSLEKFMSNFQAKIAEIFQLYDPSRKGQLQQMNKKLAQQEALRIIQAQDKQKAEDQAKQAEQIKKKTGKAPPAPKPKDPKKAAAQLQQRKKTVLANLGQKKIQELKSQTGKAWLVFKSVEQICKDFYIPKENQKPQSGQQQPPKQNQISAQESQEKLKKPLDIDELQQPIVDMSGQPVVTKNAFLRIKVLAQLVLSLRNNFFNNIGIKSKRVYQNANQNDKDMLEDSLMTLDSRLKQHYSMKGKLQQQIYIKRSGQITNHKKKYEKYARMVKQKMDLQTEKFNYLLEKSLQLMKSHSTLQNQVRQQIPNGKNLSQLQGLLGKARQNSNTFSTEIKYQCMELDRLSNSQIDNLLKKNDDFIKECKHIDNGGEYSNEQLDWYKQMISQINKQIEEQKVKRNQKMNQIKEHTEKKRKQLLEKFEKQYATTIEELSAKDGTGKKYGRPKRIAQQKIRFQMNKCQKAQISIDNQIKKIQEEYFAAKNQSFKFNQKPSTLKWRQMNMTLQTCIIRYAKHIEALNANQKVNQMIRVNYDENLSQCALPGSSQEQDKKRLEKELSALGPLSQQKDDRVLTKYVQQIEKVITDQTRNIYTGDKAKYLTGNDKIPDFLRVYIGNMKKNAQQFRLNSIRQLRNSCSRFSELSEKISQMFFRSITQFYSKNQQQNFKENKNSFNVIYKEHYKLKQINLRDLRPNLSNPKCQDQLKQLDQKQKKRSEDFVVKAKQVLKLFEDNHFDNASKYLNGILNNFEFLIIFLDSLYLREDFVKVPGDQAEQKKHLDIKRLMLMKQKGIKIDTNSQRNLKRKWQGIKITVFDLQQKKFVYNKVVAQQPKQKDKKAAKKQAKDPKKGAIQQNVNQSPDISKQIQTFKTWRQKSVFIYRNESYQRIKTQYQKILKDMQQTIQNSITQNNNFKIKWQAIAKELYL